MFNNGHIITAHSILNSKYLCMASTLNVQSFYMCTILNSSVIRPQHFDKVFTTSLDTEKLFTMFIIHDLNELIDVLSVQ